MNKKLLLFSAFLGVVIFAFAAGSIEPVFADDPLNPVCNGGPCEPEIVGEIEIHKTTVWDGDVPFCCLGFTFNNRGCQDSWD